MRFFGRSRGIGERNISVTLGGKRRRRWKRVSSGYINEGNKLVNGGTESLDASRLDALLMSTVETHHATVERRRDRFNGVVALWETREPLVIILSWDACCAL